MLKLALMGRRPVPTVSGIRSEIAFAGEPRCSGPAYRAFQHVIFSAPGHAAIAACTTTSPKSALAFGAEVRAALCHENPLYPSPTGQAGLPGPAVNTMRQLETAL